MAIQRVQNLIVAADTAVVGSGLQVNATNINTQGTIAIANGSNLTVAPGITISDAESLIIYNFITANSSLKRTLPINGRKVTRYSGTKYSPATRNVVAVGYNRKTAAGTIPVNASTEYQFTIHVKSDKQNYSERNLLVTYEFVSSATATQSTIATQIVNAINGPSVSQTGTMSYIPKLLSAVKVGDGTGAYGLTGAANFGVELTGLVLTQANGSYALEIPMFEVDVNDLSGFGANFRPTVIQTPFQGSGSYQHIYNYENFLLGTEGKINRTVWPIPVDNFQVSSTPVISSQVTGSGNVGVTATNDLVTFATTNASFAPGDLLTMTDGSSVAQNCEIKYLIGTTQAVLVTPFQSTTQANSVVKKRGFYNTLEIEQALPALFDGAGINGDSKSGVMLCIPAWTAAAAYNVTSTSAASILGILNPYMASLGFANIQF